MPIPLLEKNAKRLRIYIGDSDQWRGRPLYTAVLDYLKKEGVAGATVTRGVAGFGAHSHIHTAAILDLSADLPLVIEVIDTPEKIQHILETISAMVGEGLITLEDVEVIAYTHRFLHPLPLDRHVGEIMTVDPVTLRAEQTVLAAWEMMLGQNIKELAVVDEHQQVVGVFTSGDIMERAGVNARLAVAQRLDEESLSGEMETLRKANLTVKSLMSQPPITVHSEDPIGLAAERLVKNNITRLPVVNETGNLLGMVSQLDLLRLVMDIPERIEKREPGRGDGHLAEEVMSKEVPQVQEEADLAGIIASFLSSGEDRVIVVNTVGHPVGLITDSDVIGRIQPVHRRGVLGALRGWANPPKIEITAKELMSAGVETILGNTPVIEGIRKMVTSTRKWLVVVDTAGKPIGLIDREIALEALIR